MEDSVTPNISIALYHYLCQHIVGSEDHVKQIRMMNAVRDNLSSNKEVTIITSGSFGEGLDMRGSDFDIMMVLRHLEVYEDVKLQFNQNITYFSIEKDDVKPGYVQLRLDYSQFPRKLFKWCEEQNGKLNLSSTLYKQWFIQNSYGTIHGPCLSDRTGYFDIAVCLHCKTWISPAVQWITRSNNSWPSHNVKQSIIKHGVLLVPIGVKGSPNEELEWRVSFSVGEKFLINTLTHTQLLCYVLLKIILKDVITSFSECEDLLCSYFLKTIVFWISEELPQSVWKPDYIIQCFMRCFSRLVYCVEHSVCLNYFIPENNMFENKIVGRSREVLLEKLYMLHSYNWRCILFSDQIHNINSSIFNFHIEPHTLFAKDVEKILTSKLLHFANDNSTFRTSNTVNERTMMSLFSSDSSTCKDIYKFPCPAQTTH
ncbi:cyclic GMP-AMP synthase-like receptor 2 [Mytilus edulis]|uniref:cyclic GMP-AMP synthase-like receptor 2 n=1 Tax=Mytilus edulis TaxID=6550 RepID=UPI0039EFF383